MRPLLLAGLCLVIACQKAPPPAPVFESTPPPPPPRLLAPGEVAELERQIASAQAIAEHKALEARITMFRASCMSARGRLDEGGCGGMATSGQPVFGYSYVPASAILSVQLTRKLPDQKTDTIGISIIPHETKSQTMTGDWQPVSARRCRIGDVIRRASDAGFEVSRSFALSFHAGTGTIEGSWSFWRNAGDQRTLTDDCP